MNLYNLHQRLDHIESYLESMSYSRSVEEIDQLVATLNSSMYLDKWLRNTGDPLDQYNFLIEGVQVDMITADVVGPIKKDVFQKAKGIFSKTNEIPTVTFPTIILDEKNVIPCEPVTGIHYNDLNPHVTVENFRKSGQLLLSLVDTFQYVEKKIPHKSQHYVMDGPGRGHYATTTTYTGTGTYGIEKHENVLILNSAPPFITDNPSVKYANKTNLLLADSPGAEIGKNIKTNQQRRDAVETVLETNCWSFSTKPWQIIK